MGFAPIVERPTKRLVGAYDGARGIRLGLLDERKLFHVQISLVDFAFIARVEHHEYLPSRGRNLPME